MSQIDKMSQIEQPTFYTPIFRGSFWVVFKNVRQH
jgi:hypothetical protein